MTRILMIIILTVTAIYSSPVTANEKNMASFKQLFNSSDSTDKLTTFIVLKVSASSCGYPLKIGRELHDLLVERVVGVIKKEAPSIDSHSVEWNNLMWDIMINVYLKEIPGMERGVKIAMKRDNKLDKSEYCPLFYREAKKRGMIWIPPSEAYKQWENSDLPPEDGDELENN